MTKLERSIPESRPTRRGKEWRFDKSNTKLKPSKFTDYTNTHAGVESIHMTALNTLDAYLAPNTKSALAAILGNDESMVIVFTPVRGGNDQPTSESPKIDFIAGVKTDRESVPLDTDAINNHLDGTDKYAIYGYTYFNSFKNTSEASFGTKDQKVLFQHGVRVLHFQLLTLEKALEETEFKLEDAERRRERPESLIARRVELLKRINSNPTPLFPAKNS